MRRCARVQQCLPSDPAAGPAVARLCKGDLLIRQAVSRSGPPGRWMEISFDASLKLRLGLYDLVRRMKAGSGEEAARWFALLSAQDHVTALAAYWEEPVTIDPELLMIGLQEMSGQFISDISRNPRMTVLPASKLQEASEAEIEPLLGYLGHHLLGQACNARAMQEIELYLTPAAGCSRAIM